jgi:tRNA-splicing ligase RtcB (3'-phosphate/5'-hydroxy nucleic acid ligase)
MSEVKDRHAAPLKQWLAMPMEPAASQAIERVRRADDVVHVAVMPDVHLAVDVCVGTAMATRRLVYPSAVGGDIGCGMLAIAFDESADILRDPQNAGALLRSLSEHIPSQRRNRAKTLAFPPDLNPTELSHPSLRAAAQSEGALQFATLGGGNHFIELQSDEQNRLWLMIHSGSRAIGQAVKAHHLSRASIRSASMLALNTDTLQGQEYLHDQDWARRFADANRRAIAGQVISILREVFRADPVESSLIACDHNHVRLEEHFGQMLLVHRKGSMPAAEELPGVVPGSMGTTSFHVEGRGCADSLHSSAHGAGRMFSRNQARQRFTRADLRRQMQGVWFDPRLSESLREESPKSYKNIEVVMRAQSDLIKITRRLRPLLVYKGR